MRDPDPLEQRLSALGSGPLPLPDVAAVRARGDRRRRSRQAALACAAVLAAGTLGGGVALLSGGGGQDALRSAVAPSSSPEPGPEPTCVTASRLPTPVPGDEVVYSGSYAPYCSEVTIEPAEPPTPTPAPSPLAEPTPTSTPAPAPAPWTVEDALLSPDGAARAEMPGWTVGSLDEPTSGPLLDPCDEHDSFGDVEGFAEQSMSSTRETGGSRLVQQAVRYPDEAAATAAFDALAAAVAACPESPAARGEQGDTTQLEVAGQGGVQGSRTLLVRITPCSGAAGCIDSYRSYFLLAQVGDGLTNAYYGLGEDGDPERFAAELLDAVAAQLVRAVVG